ncbi:MAG: hypothetical protein ACR2Q4_17965 [Geminicoccaceae bacterium]
MPNQLRCAIFAHASVVWRHRQSNVSATLLVLSGAEWQMPRHLVSLSASLALALFTAPALAVEKSQHKCSNGSLVRRVVIEVGDPVSSLPCEVVYWKDVEAPGVRRVLWSARSDANFCVSEAAGLVDKLRKSGWRCDGDGEPVEANVQPSQPATAVPTVDAATVAGALAEQQPLSDLTQEQTTPNETQTAAVVPSTPTPPSAQQETTTPSPQLEAVITQNLESLNKSVDGDFQAQIAQFGDLNSDSYDDAIVFFNYKSGSADSTQFVAAYLFNGDSYHLAATKPVGGTDRAVKKVEIENIVDGSIQLKLHLNDASQSESRQAAMVLRDGQLIETE